MQLSDMAGYFKKYWKDRHQIAATGNIRASLGSAAAAASGQFTTASGATPKVVRPGKPKRDGYAQERNAAQLVELAALAERIQGENPAGQVDIDKLKNEALHQLRSKTYDHQALAKALSKAMKQKSFAKAYKQVRSNDVDLWEDVEKHLHGLADSDKKNRREALSGNLKDVAAHGFASFLGPAGPLFLIARELKQEFHGESKAISEQVGRMTKGTKNWLKSIREHGGKSGFMFQRWTTKLKNGLLKITSKFGGMLKGIWDFFTGNKTRRAGRVFGKAGGGIARGAIGGARMLTNPKVLAAVAAAGLAAAAVSHVSQNAESETTDPNAPGKSPKAVDLKELGNAAKVAVGALFGPFAGLGMLVTSNWDTLQKLSSQTFHKINTAYDDAVLKGKITKDSAEQIRDQLWDDIKDWLAGLWKRFVPAGVRNLASRFGEGVKRLVGKQDDAKQAGDGTGSPSKLNMTGGGTGDAKRGEQSVKVVSGADVAGMNPGVMKNFYAMADEFYNTTGRRLQVNSAKRDGAKQAQLYAQNPGKAARPGYSMHEYGLALDINSAEANQLDKSGLLAKYGFMRPLLNAGETWHIEPISIQGQKAAIRAGKAKMEEPGAIASSAPPPSTETEGASNKQLTTSMNSATPATDARNAEQAKYKASDNYGDGASSASVSQSVTPTVPASTANTVSSTEPAVAPKETAGYERVASRSKVIETDVQAPAPQPKLQVDGGGRSVTSVNSVPTHLGDMGMLTVNLGAA